MIDVRRWVKRWGEGSDEALEAETIEVFWSLWGQSGEEGRCENLALLGIREVII